jgi:hypothetical protein
VSALKKPAHRFQSLYAEPTPEKKAVESLIAKIQHLLVQDPQMQKKAARVIELWLNKSKK